MGLKEKAIDKIKYDGLKLQTLADKWKNDLDFVFIACQNSGFEKETE
jgi:hypothetical protein